MKITDLRATPVNLPTALSIARHIEPCDVRNWEEPVATYDDPGADGRRRRLPLV